MWQCSSARISNLERVIKHSFIRTWPQEAKNNEQETVQEISPPFHIQKAERELHHLSPSTIRAV